MSKCLHTSRHIIHTVGPVYSSSGVDVKAQQLASCYKTSLELAANNSLKHIVRAHHRYHRQPARLNGFAGVPLHLHRHLRISHPRCHAYCPRRRETVLGFSRRRQGEYSSAFPPCNERSPALAMFSLSALFLSYGVTPTSWCTSAYYNLLAKRRRPHLSAETCSRYTSLQAQMTREIAQPEVYGDASRKFPGCMMKVYNMDRQCFPSNVDHGNARSLY